MVLLRYANSLLGRLWELGTAYDKVSVVLDRLGPPGTCQQLILFYSYPSSSRELKGRKDAGDQPTGPTRKRLLSAGS